MFQEYEQILAGVRNGTLAPQPTPPPPVPKMVQAKRFSHSHGAGSFCEQFNSKKWSPIGYSFGNFHRSDASLVFISKELSKGEAGISPGPAQYTIKTTIGPAASRDSRNRREPMTDRRGGAEVGARALHAEGVRRALPRRRRAGEAEEEGEVEQRGRRTATTGGDQFAAG